jgi:hypothetical protein
MWRPFRERKHGSKVRDCKCPSRSTTDDHQGDLGSRDLTRELGADFGNCYVKTRRNEKTYLEDVSILRDDRADDHFHFLRGAKADALHDIVAARGRAGERGVIFTRTITRGGTEAHSRVYRSAPV